MRLRDAHQDHKLVTSIVTKSTYLLPFKLLLAFLHSDNSSKGTDLGDTTQDIAKTPNELDSLRQLCCVIRTMPIEVRH